ncbi:hypothetical protein D5R81_16425 [Parashewanella spongiae]|uniref:Uncharacterized protein n=1 Tax=Parashewanella spongiae TaxID=342950 RepID=A0A3A6TBY8_9GAMM|nr:hypothetical protein D5R81_16425 [Parashewanella spongiae]
MFHKGKKLFGLIGLIISVTGIIDLIFYWPVSSYDNFFLIKRVAYIIAGASIFWLHLLKAQLKNNN